MFYLRKNGFLDVRRDLPYWNKEGVLLAAICDFHKKIMW